MNYNENILIDGIIGKIEISINYPNKVFKKNKFSQNGTVIITHPHPLFGGCMKNKVCKIISDTFLKLNFITYLLNFRGVGKTDGTFDNGIGECDDLLVLLKYIKKKQKKYSPLILSGFSFGTYVLSNFIKKIKKNEKIKKILFIGTAVKNYKINTIKKKSIIIHGEIDEIININHIFNWAKIQEIPVIVIPGATHFFHKKLHILQNTILNLFN